jgi:phosphatidylglycerol:prolipoprotein diacylglycerol transferase
MLAIVFGNISPVAISFGGFDVRWYALSYIFSALIAFMYIKYLNKKSLLINGDNSKIFFDDLLFYTLLGIILGGRIGYILFYGYDYYSNNFLKIFHIWEGGMSYHGGLLGVIFATHLFCKKYNVKFFQITDMLATAMPIGLFFGRIANFVNAELYGKITNVPWGVIFPNEILPRHPSQLYEAFLEGLLLFIILLILWNKHYYKVRGFISGFALFLYGLFRFVVEFVRQGEIYFFDVISMGQVLCLIMVIAGGCIIYWSRKNLNQGYGKK